jgi:pimeloyl-ACP methyl ester carboxylesterase
VTERALAGTKIEANGLTHHVVDAGDGPAVVLLHGFPDTADLWRHQVPELVDAGFRVVAPDLRGFGDTDKPVGVNNYVLFNAVADVGSIMTTLGIERATIVGHDFGAGVAWLFAMSEPALVERLVAVSVGHPGAFTRARFKQMQQSWYSFLFQYEGLAEDLLAKDGWSLFREWLASSPDLERSLAAMSEPASLTAGLSWYRANMTPQIWGVEIPFPEIAVPTMGVWGSTDFALGEEQMTDSVQYLTGPWRYERIEGAGHWLMLERPEEFHALLIEFLRGKA